MNVKRANRRMSRGTLSADAVRVGLLVAAAGLLVAGHDAAAVKMVLLLPATLAARLVGVQPLVDLIFALALAVEGVGSALASQGVVAWDDRLSHLLLPFLSGPVAYTALARLGVVGRLRAGLLTGVAVFAIAALWEVVEWVVDAAAGTDFSMGRRDTVGDLSADALAATGAGVAVVGWLHVTRPCDRGRAEAP